MDKGFVNIPQLSVRTGPRRHGAAREE